MPGRYISFDEQMVLCRCRASKFMQKHMPAKPIKNGENVSTARTVEQWRAYAVFGW